MKMTKNLSQLAAVILFGVIVPIAVLYQAHQGINSLQNNVAHKDTINTLFADFKGLKSNSMTGNDYALISLMYTEHANQKTMINKQIMKVSVIQIGFAVISIGIMLVVLGISRGGAEGGGSYMGFEFDVKIGSSGVLVFVIGAAMSTLGGVLKNDYATVPIPPYVQNSSEIDNVAEFYLGCNKLSDQKLVVMECFWDSYESMIKEKE
ncbi:hypothetical protein AB4278_16595 [Vibrio splendidus]